MATRTITEMANYGQVATQGQVATHGPPRVAMAILRLAGTSAVYGHGHSPGSSAMTAASWPTMKLRSANHEGQLANHGGWLANRLSGTRTGPVRS